MNCLAKSRVLVVTVAGAFDSTNAEAMKKELSPLGAVELTLFSSASKTLDLDASVLFEIETLHCASDIKRLLMQQTGVKTVITREKNHVC